MANFFTKKWLFLAKLKIFFFFFVAQQCTHFFIASYTGHILIGDIEQCYLKKLNFSHKKLAFFVDCLLKSFF